MKKTKMKKTFKNLAKLELLTRQIANDMKSQQLYDFKQMESGLMCCADWIKKETKKIKGMDR